MVRRRWGQVATAIFLLFLLTPAGCGVNSASPQVPVKGQCAQRRKLSCTALHCEGYPWWELARSTGKGSDAVTCERYTGLRGQRGGCSSPGRPAELSAHSVFCAVSCEASGNATFSLGCCGEARQSSWESSPSGQPSAEVCEGKSQSWQGSSARAAWAQDPAGCCLQQAPEQKSVLNPKPKRPCSRQNDKSQTWEREKTAVLEGAADGHVQPEGGPHGDVRKEKASESKSTSSDKASQGRSWEATSAIKDQWIVRFTEYRHAAEHLQTLEAKLGRPGADSWQWVERKNPAAAFPTDFGLLTFAAPAEQRLKQRVAGLSFVKDVNPQMRFTRALMSEDPDPPKQDSWQRGRGDKSKEGGNRAEQGGAAGSHAEGTCPGKSDEDAGGGPEQECRYDQRAPIEKPPGRFKTRMSWGEDEDVEGGLGGGRAPSGPFWGNLSLAESERRQLLQVSKSQITSLFQAEKLWARGFSGALVRMAVFDTGVREDHPHFRNIRERTNWTNEDTLNDGLGHGTFVAGVISGQDAQCRGFAPDVEIYAFRVFTNAQVSYTSWFLDAFNYAIATKMNVLNLSIGGPDYMDRPFVEKVWEMTANNIIMVSAIGNDGPLYGTLNNPADQSDVIGVGGIDYSDHIASFSSRGMSTWELPHGYGRVKPDVVAYGREVIGSRISSGCKSLSGTSVASPVVAGAVCLLASVVPAERRWEVLNPASMKQALVEGAERLEGPNMYEQGVGRLNLLGSYKVLAEYQPRASVLPAALDLTQCPYAWPFCRQPLYASAMPIMFNATILNGMGVAGWLEAPPVWEPAPRAGAMLDVQFTYSEVIWPWSGYLGIYLRVTAEGRRYTGSIEGEISFTVVSPAGKGELQERRWTCRVPLKVDVVPTPPREKRVLWDQFHNVRYPPGYIPRDSLDVRNDILDWHGDHLHTNYHGLYDALRDAGYFVEVLGSPFTCFEAEQYGTLLLVDLEDEFFEEEMEKLREDVQQRGLGLVVFAEWYHVDTMVRMRFFDDNTRSWWTPVTGGANVPALNDLLAPFGIAFGDSILNGLFSIAGERAQYSSGTDIRRFPAGGFLHRFLFHDAAGTAGGIVSSRTATIRAQAESPILGLTTAGRGRVAVYGDSNCLDSSHMITSCYWLLKKMAAFASTGKRDPVLFAAANELAAPLGSAEQPLPRLRDDINFTDYSLVLGREPVCGLNAPLELRGTAGRIPAGFERGRRKRTHDRQAEERERRRAEERKGPQPRGSGGGGEDPLPVERAASGVQAGPGEEGAEEQEKGGGQTGTRGGEGLGQIQDAGSSREEAGEESQSGAGTTQAAVRAQPGSLEAGARGEAGGVQKQASRGGGVQSLSGSTMPSAKAGETPPGGELGFGADKGRQSSAAAVRNTGAAVGEAGGQQEGTLGEEATAVDKAVEKRTAKVEALTEQLDRMTEKVAQVDSQLGERGRQDKGSGQVAQSEDRGQVGATGAGAGREAGSTHRAADTARSRAGAHPQPVLGWGHRTQANDELDASLLAYQWLIGGGLGASGFLLIWSLWRVRHGRRRRRFVRKGLHATRAIPL